MLTFTWRFICGIGLLGALALLIPRLITALYAFTRIFSVADAPAERFGIVFGAGLRRDGTATAILRDRVQTAAELYFSGKVETLVMSGDNSEPGYNEPEAMRQHAVSLGVPTQAIVLDYAGRRTYDTCYRARAVFDIESALLITQDFHLPRAVFTCNALGLRAAGVKADNLYYLRRSRAYWNVRELFATFGAFMDLYTKAPATVLGKPEPILATKPVPEGPSKMRTKQA